MIPSPSLSPSPSLRQEATILRVKGRRDIHVEGYGSSGEGGTQAWAVGRYWKGLERGYTAPRIGYGSDIQPL